MNFAQVASWATLEFARIFGLGLSLRPAACPDCRPTLACAAVPPCPACNCGAGAGAVSESWLFTGLVGFLCFAAGIAGGAWVACRPRGGTPPVHKGSVDTPVAADVLEVLPPDLAEVARSQVKLRHGAASRR